MSEESEQLPKIKSPKIQKFIAEYLKDQNGTQAAIRAGYSKKTATSQASELLKRPDVSKHVQFHMQKNLDQALEVSRIGADDLIKELEAIAMSKFTDFADEDKITGKIKRKSIDKIKAMGGSIGGYLHKDNASFQWFPQAKMEAIKILMRYHGIDGSRVEKDSRDRGTEFDRVREAMARIKRRKAKSDKSSGESQP